MAKREKEKDLLTLFEANQIYRQQEKERAEEVSGLQRAAHKAIDGAFRKAGGGGHSPHDADREQKPLRAPQS